MSDWADKKAREWLHKEWPSVDWASAVVQGLAALLREVAEGHGPYAMKSARQVVLAEVRRVVVEEVLHLAAWAGHGGGHMARWNNLAPGATWLRDEILARLEKL